MTNQLYKPSLALLTDLYQLTMAYGYWKQGRAEDEAVFHLFYRKAPFGGDFAIACGIESAVDFLENFRFETEDLDYLETLTGRDGNPLFEKNFLTYLGAMKFECEVLAVDEGEVVFANEPLVRVRGPLIQAQLVETAFLNLVNFQTLIATKASRIVEAAAGDPVLEFGLRRAQGVDGGISASRAAYVGGCVGTSNLMAGRLFGIPVRGTHAHSWVMCFDSELEAFDAYAASLPNNVVFLVDTYDTVEGVENAIQIGRKMRESGHELLGIRLDSGDMAKLSIQARQMLDAGGFPDAAIVASNDLDEYRIAELKAAGAMIGVWGVGTRLATAYDQPALGGVYKLAALKRKGDSDWEFRVKLSNDRIKVSIPGIQQVRRVIDAVTGLPKRDVIWCEALSEPKEPGRDLLKPVFPRREPPLPIEEIRDRAIANAAQFRSLPSYQVDLDPNLERCRDALIDRHLTG